MKTSKNSKVIVRGISVLLSVIIISSVLTILPFSASAITNGAIITLGGNGAYINNTQVYVTTYDEDVNNSDCCFNRHYKLEDNKAKNYSQFFQNMGSNRDTLNFHYWYNLAELKKRFCEEEGLWACINTKKITDVILCEGTYATPGLSGILYNDDFTFGVAYHTDIYKVHCNHGIMAFSDSIDNFYLGTQILIFQINTNYTNTFKIDNNKKSRIVDEAEGQIQIRDYITNFKEEFFRPSEPRIIRQFNDNRQFNDKPLISAVAMEDDDCIIYRNKECYGVRNEEKPDKDLFPDGDYKDPDTNEFSSDFLEYAIDGAVSFITDDQIGMFANTLKYAINQLTANNIKKNTRPDIAYFQEKKTFDEIENQKYVGLQLKDNSYLAPCEDKDSGQGVFEVDQKDKKVSYLKLNTRIIEKKRDAGDSKKDKRTVEFSYHFSVLFENKRLYEITNGFDIPFSSRRNRYVKLDSNVDHVYQYEVRSFSSSESTSSGSGTTTEQIGKVENLLVYKNLPNSIDIGWKDATGVSDYQIDVYDKTDNDKKIHTGTYTKHARCPIYTIEGLKQNHKYAIKVNAYKENAQGKKIYGEYAVIYAYPADRDLSKYKITFSNKKDTFVYTGNPIDWGTVKLVDSHGNSIRERADYEVNYADNINVGTATVTVKGVGKFTGSQKFTFTISESTSSGSGTTTEQIGKVENLLVYKNLPNSIDIGWKDATGVSDYQIDVYDKTDNDKKIHTGTNTKHMRRPIYTIEGLKQNHKYAIKVKAYKENAQGKKTYGEYAVIYAYPADRDLSKYKITFSNKKNTFVYTGNPIDWGTVKLVDSHGNSIREHADYEVNYADNINVGTATVTVKGVGKFTGSQVMKFYINAPTLPAPQNFKVTALSPNSVRLSWDKVSNASGYKITKIENPGYQGGSSKSEPIGNTNAVSLYGLKAGTEYAFNIAAVHKDKAGHESPGAPAATNSVYTPYTDISMYNISFVNDTSNLLTPLIKSAVDSHGNKLTNKDYKVSYSDSNGEVTVTVNGVGSYNGKKVIKKRILEKVTGLKSKPYPEANPNVISVSWKKVNNATGYKVTVIDTSVNYYTQRPCHLYTTNPYLDIYKVNELGIKEGTEYYVTVTPYYKDSNHLGPESEKISVSTPFRDLSEYTMSFETSAPSSDLPKVILEDENGVRLKEGTHFLAKKTIKNTNQIALPLTNNKLVMVKVEVVGRGHYKGTQTRELPAMIQK